MRSLLLNEIASEKIRTGDLSFRRGEGSHGSRRRQRPLAGHARRFCSAPLRNRHRSGRIAMERFRRLTPCKHGSAPGGNRPQWGRRTQLILPASYCDITHWYAPASNPFLARCLCSRRNDPQPAHSHANGDPVWVPAFRLRALRFGGLEPTVARRGRLSAS
jgi:hypothetical protein